MKLLKKIIIFIFVIMIILLVNGIINNNSRIKIELDSCVDGDTAWFLINGERKKVRFLGVDTPESTIYIEDYGVESSVYTCNLLKNAKNIYLEYYFNSDRYDKYDRVLGWIFVDNNNLSELLLSKGYAHVDYIYGDYLYIEDLCIAQRDAYLAKIGIWSVGNEDEYQNNYCRKVSFK